ncbi:probable serine/threonine-protein kinase tsuA isoform X1 [Lucilia cuprina]|uniref:probable serine/threonine-protein kinase tsuA isoform X1 n=1 Tax=Lucilia cuprina TaxID=7375 RepID=UPI001F064C79|nr:probable serine/threonine-protein kinase tsuA isoform X1 [Lucilia cuprina]
MEPNDEVVERQKLVDVETEEDVTNSAPKSAPTPASPMAVPKINIKSISSGETTRSRNSASCSIERTTTTSEKIGGGQSSAKVTYVNERRPRPHLHGTNDERFEFKSRPRKLLKDIGDGDSINGITQLSSETLSDETCINSNIKNNNNNNNNYNSNNKNNNINNTTVKTTSTSSLNQTSLTTTTNTTTKAAVISCEATSNTLSSSSGSGLAGGSTNSSSGSHHHHYHQHQHQYHNASSNNNSNNHNVIDNTPLIQRRKPNVNNAAISVSAGYPGLISSANIGSLSDKFDQRPIKHHSFVSEVPDVKHMERALLGLLDDFHSGKLKAFGSGCTMDQMTKIREQQESLAKLHFELAAAEEDSLENGNDFNAAKAQENMLQLMQRLEQLSISIEQLQTSHTGL